MNAAILFLIGLSLVGITACDEARGENANNGGSGAAPSDSQSGTSTLDGNTEPGPRRVVGYLPTYRNLDPDLLDFNTLTHLCIAFANPTGSGSESDFDEAARDKIAPIVTKAHANGVKVLASIAGGTKSSGEIVAAQLIPEKVDAYVAGLVDLIERYELDGIDNDIEGEAVNEDYETFVTKLSKALPEEKLLTAAVATKNGDPVPDGALLQYDFINIMAYDHCSWTEAACDQASLEGVEADLTYWTVTRGVPRARAVLGVPFYGWCWGCTESQSAVTYSQILWEYPEAATSDWIEDGDKKISLNSATTIEKKAQLAHEYGGIMIWELGQDAAGDGSLMQVIAQEN